MNSLLQTGPLSWTLIHLRNPIAIVSKRPNSASRYCIAFAGRYRDRISSRSSTATLLYWTHATMFAAYDAVQNSSYHSFFVFTVEQQRRLDLARQRTEALVIFRVALASRSPRRIVAAYNHVLDTGRHTTQDERDQLALANSFI